LNLKIKKVTKNRKMKPKFGNLSRKIGGYLGAIRTNFVAGGPDKNLQKPHFRDQGSPGIAGGPFIALYQ
jgi:hypothetical protein